MRYDPWIDPEVSLTTRIDALAGRSDPQSETKRAFFSHVLKDIDFESYRTMQAGYRERANLGTYVKFLDLGYWLDAKFDIVWQFGLHERPPLSIIDVGAGVGNFAYICRYFGHDCLSMDVGKVAIYDDMTALFRVPRVIGRVDPLVPLQSFGRRFDLLTAFMAVFDKKADKSGNWQEPEWTFLLNDIARNHLTGSGEVLLKISLKNYDEAFREFLQRSGAEVTEKGSFVRYPSLAFFS